MYMLSFRATEFVYTDNILYLTKLNNLNWYRYPSTQIDSIVEII